MTKWLSDGTCLSRKIHIFDRVGTIYNTFAIREHVTLRTQRHWNFDGNGSYLTSDLSLSNAENKKSTSKKYAVFLMLLGEND